MCCSERVKKYRIGVKIALKPTDSGEGRLTGWRVSHHQAPPCGPTPSQRAARRDVAVQTAGLTGLLLRSALIQRVRDRRDPACAEFGRSGAARPHPLGGTGRHRVARRGGGVVSADLLRIPERWWCVRGQPGEPGSQRGPGGGQCLARRLCAHGRGFSSRRRGRDHLGIPQPPAVLG